MSSRKDSSVIEMRPDAVWQEMSSDKDAALVDVRTPPEWAFVGIPDLSALGRQAILAEWQRFPTMEFNHEFAENIDYALAGSNPSSVYFICRSGQRSRAAAVHYKEFSEARSRAVRCVNVSEGFEGVLDEFGHRSQIDGWKRRGLPWRQS